MEQSECECPCECPLELQTCDASRPRTSDPDWLPTCSPVAETNPSLQLYPRFRDLDLLADCLALDCEERISEGECFGVVGCEWCVRDVDGQTPLQVLP